MNRGFLPPHKQTHINLNHAGAQNAVYTQWHDANAPADCHTQGLFFIIILSKLKFLHYAFFTFQLAFILSVSRFNKVFWFIADGCLYFVLIIGCYWKDEFHWFCGWLGALLSQTVDCQQGLCWVEIDAAESPPSAFYLLLSPLIETCNSSAAIITLTLSFCVCCTWSGFPLFLRNISLQQVLPSFPFLTNELRVLLWPVNINHGGRKADSD